MLAKETQMLLAEIDLPSKALDYLVIVSVLFAIIGTLFLAYDLLGRENGPLRWFTLVITCGLVSAIILGIIFTLIFKILYNTINFNFILQFLVLGGLMGFFTVILIELPTSKTRPAIFSRTATLIGLTLGFLFALVVKILGGPLEAALAIGVPCAIIISVWQRITWEPTQAASNPRGVWQFVAWEEPSPSNPNPRGSWKFVGWEQAHPRPQPFSRKRFLLGLGSGFLCWFIISLIASKDITVALLESVPFALVSGVIGSTWRYINWEPPHPRPHIFSRKGFWNGFVAGFMIWFILLVEMNDVLNRYSGSQAGFVAMLTLSILILSAGALALATAVAGSIAQYTLWRANNLPHRILGAFGLVLLILALVLQGVQPVINITNGVK
jgi:hypothetical protein